MRPFTAEQFKSLYSQVPRLCVEVVVRTPTGIVLTKRSIEPWKGAWHIPGGTVFYQESLADAVHRIAQDELGVEVKIEKEIGSIEYPSEFEERSWGHSVGIAFEASIVSGTLRGSEQGEEVAVFKTLPENLIAEQKQFLQRIGF